MKAMVSVREDQIVKAKRIFLKNNLNLYTSKS